jgi:hypothetical protein
MQIGMSWIEAADWQRYREVMSDRASLHDTHAEWLTDALSRERDVQEQGVDVRRITLKPDVFLTWCTIRGLSPDGPSRARYVAEMLQDQAKRSSTV